MTCTYGFLYSQEEYRAKKNCLDYLTQPSFDFSDYFEVIGSSSKGRLYGTASDQRIEGSRNGYTPQSSIVGDNNDRITELSKAVDDMRAITTNMIEEAKRKEEEENKKREKDRLWIEQALEEGRKREEMIQEILHKMFPEWGYTNHRFTSGFGAREQRQFDGK